MIRAQEKGEKEKKISWNCRNVKKKIAVAKKFEFFPSKISADNYRKIKKRR